MTNDDDRILWGVAEIAAEIGRSEQQTYRLIKNGYLDVSRVGARFSTTRRRLRRLFDTSVSQRKVSYLERRERVEAAEAEEAIA